MTHVSAEREVTYFPSDQLLLHTRLGGEVQPIWKGTLKQTIPVIVKTLPIGSPSGQGQCPHECSLLSRVRSPSVVAALGVTELNSQPALVLRDIGAVELTSVRSELRSLSEICNVGYQVALGLAALHESGITHGNVNPHHLVYAAALHHIQIIDLSSGVLGKRYTETCKPHQNSQTHYTAPEQTGRVSRPIDARADLYALGVMLFDLMTGAPPFAELNGVELLHAQIAVLPQPLFDQCLPDGTPVPIGLGQIVSRLLRKDPDHRYQTANEVADDLEPLLQCSPEEARRFRPVRATAAPRQHLPIQQVGREQALEQLRRTHEAVRSGQSALTVLSGASGSGKTTLVRESFRSAQNGHEILAEGKFDQLQREVPRAAVLQALRHFCRGLLSLPPAELEWWRTQLTKALGQTTTLLPEYLPEAALLFPSKNAHSITTKAGDAGQILARFTAAIGATGRPLTIFLDDVQWADDASWQWLQALPNVAALQHLHIVIACRTGELTEPKRLTELLRCWKTRDANVTEIEIGSFTQHNVAQLLATATECPLEEVDGLAALVYNKTLGNPFYVQEFWSMLVQRGLTRWDRAAGRWTWDTTGIAQHVHADDAPNVLSMRVMELNAAVLNVLQVSASLGTGTDVQTIARAAGQSNESIVQAMAHAEHCGIVSVVAPDRPTSPPNIHFCHDKIQHAVLSTVPTEGAGNRLFKMANNLAAHLDGNSQHSERYLVLGLFNSALALHPGLDTAGERALVIRLNLQGAERALDTQAYASCQEYVGMALSLLGRAGWRAQYALTLQANILQAQVLARRGDLAALNTTAELISTHAKTALDAAPVLRAQVRAETYFGSSPKAMTIGKSALAALGFCMISYEQAPQAPFPLSTLPELTNARAAAAMRLLADLGSCAYLAVREDFPGIVATMLCILKKYGTTPYAGPGLAWNSTLCLASQRYPEAAQWGKMAEELVDKHDLDGLACQTLFLKTVSAAFATDDLGTITHHFADICKLGTETANLEFVSWSALSAFQYEVSGGQSLDCVQATLAERTQDVDGSPPAAALLRVWAQVVENLNGKVDSPDVLTGTHWTAGSMPPPLRGSHTFSSIVATAEITVALIMGNFRRAAEIADANECSWEGERGVGGFFVRCFVSASARLMAIEPGDTSQGRWIELAKRDTGELRLWGKTAPTSANHKVALLEAELARIKGDSSQATTLYDRAISGAKRARCSQGVALALERAALFQKHLEHFSFAESLYASARDAYLAWGASAKVNTMGSTQHETAKNTQLSHPGEQPWDIETIAKAARALSGQNARTELIKALLSLVLENAAADFGAYFVAGETLELEAYGTVNAVSLVPEAGPPHKAPSMQPANYCWRTAAPVISGNNSTTDDEQADAIQDSDHDVASLLCVPVKDADRVLGVLYLENSLVSGAFSSARVNLLSLLAAQLAVSLRNVSLYDDLRQTIANLELSNRELEDFAHIASHDLREPLRTIRSYANILQMTQNDRLDPPGRRALDWIVRGSARLSSLLSDILAYSQSGHAAAPCTKIRVDQVCQEVCNQLSQLRDDAGKDAQITWSDDLPEVRASHNDLHLILQNLISNGLKFVSQSPPHVHVRRVPSEHGHTIAVDDNGIGIAPEARELVFERFRRLHPRDTFEGSGLGLSICQRIVERIGGKIWCDESSSGGASFRFTLPEDSEKPADVHAA